MALLLQPGRTWVRSVSARGVEGSYLMQTISPLGARTAGWPVCL